MSSRNSLKISSRFGSFQKYTYSQTWPKNTNNFMTKHFLTFKHLVLSYSFQVCTVSIEFFNDLLNLPFIKNYQSKGWFE